MRAKAFQRRLKMELHLVVASQLLNLMTHMTILLFTI